MNLSFYLALPVCILLGIYLLVRCITILWKMITPDIRHQFAGNARPHVFSLPKAGRYAISIVFPPLTILPGTAYFSTQFAIKARASGIPIAYHSTSRFLLSVRRTNMRGYTSHALGYFDCATAGEYEITCLTPEKIRANFRLEITPDISVLKFALVLAGTILAAGMSVGGTIVFVLWMTGRIA